jgi:hypothetical protein
LQADNSTPKNDAAQIGTFIFTYEEAISILLLETVPDIIGCAPNWVGLPNIISQLARFTLHSATNSFILKPYVHRNNIYKNQFQLTIINRLMLFGEIVSVNYENHTEHTNTLEWVKRTVFLCRSSYHS